ncbi:riboflavin kinase [Candidatus Woesebacteria bacterium]|nr:riboflavin kinase [Candidatus Woesebacteria bacterium]
MKDDTILFSFAGFVRKDKGRGKNLGYPTANIDISPDLPEGIFLGYAKHEQQSYPSLIFIGAPITFNELDKKAEIYFLNGKKNINLYDHFLEVAVLKKIRDNKAFASKKELIQAMNKDEAIAKEFFNIAN